MKFKELLQDKWLRYLGSIYVIVLTVFAVWMLFFDTNSWLAHRELNKEIKKLEKQKAYLQSEIEKDKETIKKLKSKEGLEQYARENYYFKKDGEDVFIIEDEDSLKNKKDE